MAAYVIPTSSRIGRHVVRLLFAAFIITLGALANVYIPQPNISFAAPDDSSSFSTSTREGRLAVFDDAWETIAERYYDPAFHGVDWQARRVTFRPLAANAGDSRELYEVIREMIAPLHDVHTRVYSPAEKFDWWNPRFTTIGVTVRDIDGSPTIVRIEQNSSPERAGIRAGDVIVAVDGVPVSNLIERRSQMFQSDSSPRFRSTATFLDGPPETSVALTWQDRNGKTESASFPRYWMQRHLGLRSTHKSGFAIIEIQAFTEALAADFARALPKLLRGAKGIVLDLRANGGGDAHAMTDMASAFFGDGVDLGRFSDRSGASFDLETNSKLVWSAATLTQTSLPVVVLTSENTSSAAEILVAALQKRGRGRVIGAVTCGCVLAIRNRHALPDGGVLDVSEMDYQTAEGKRLEGAGITPDEIIRVKRKDLYSRHDPALEAAQAFLKNKAER